MPASISKKIISPREYADQQITHTLYQCGDELTYKQGLNWYRCPTDVKRGIVRGFSSAARLRMLRWISHVDWDAVGKSIFLTLTYPDPLVLRTYDDRTNDRDLFLRRIKRHVGRDFPILWRVEWEERQSGELTGQIVAHQHVCCFGVAYVHWTRVRSAWKQTLGWKGKIHTDVKGRTGRRAARYAAKYAAKQESLSGLANDAYLDACRGRCWGAPKAGCIPTRPDALVEGMTAEQIEAAFDVAEECDCSFAKRSFTILSPRAETLFDRIMDGERKKVDKRSAK